MLILAHGLAVLLTLSGSLQATEPVRSEGREIIVPGNAEVGSDTRWLERQARAGDVEAAYHLGLIHERGIGKERDAQSAAEAYQLAAEAGHGGHD